MVQIDIQIGGRGAEPGNAGPIKSQAALLPVAARNLWTQVLHADGVQTLMTRPVFGDPGQFPTIGVEFWLAEEDGCGTRFQIICATLSIGGRNHHDKANVFLSEPATMAAYKLDRGRAMVFQIDDQEVWPLGFRIIQNADQTFEPGHSITKMANSGAAIFGKHAHEETCRMAIVVDQPDERGMLYRKGHTLPLPGAAPGKITLGFSAAAAALQT